MVIDSSGHLGIRDWIRVANQFMACPIFLFEIRICVISFKDEGLSPVFLSEL